jgi:chemotaxis protein methyltransferase CheR
MGRHGDGERALRRAIYLNRHAILPHYYLGLLLQSRGDPRHAARSLENAIEILGLLPDSEILEDADGITAGEMKSLARTHLDVLRERS